MKFDKTLKTVDEIIDVIEEQIHNDDEILNDARYLELQSICETIDALVEEFDGIALDVSVDEISLSITIGIICPEMVIRNAMHPFLDLLKWVNGATFSKEGDNLFVGLVVTDLWLSMDEC